MKRRRSSGVLTARKRPFFIAAGIRATVTIPANKLTGLSTWNPAHSQVISLRLPVSGLSRVRAGGTHGDSVFFACLGADVPVKSDWGLVHERLLYLFSFILATATQQETDTEISTETLNKSSQPSSSVQPTPTETASTPKEKEGSADKSKESVTVSIIVVASNKYSM